MLNFTKLTDFKETKSVNPYRAIGLGCYFCAEMMNWIADVIYLSPLHVLCLNTLHKHQMQARSFKTSFFLFQILKFCNKRCWIKMINLGTFLMYVVYKEEVMPQNTPGCTVLYVLTLQCKYDANNNNKKNHHPGYSWFIPGTSPVEMHLKPKEFPGSKKAFFNGNVPEDSLEPYCWNEAVSYHITEREWERERDRMWGCMRQRKKNEVQTLWKRMF